jgi:hypothetical protein
MPASTHLRRGQIDDGLAEGAGRVHPMAVGEAPVCAGADPAA